MTNQRFDFPFVGVSNSNGSINKLSKKKQKKKHWNIVWGCLKIMGMKSIGTVLYLFDSEMIVELHEFQYIYIKIYILFPLSITITQKKSIFFVGNLQTCKQCFEVESNNLHFPSKKAFSFSYTEIIPLIPTIFLLLLF